MAVEAYDASALPGVAAVGADDLWEYLNRLSSMEHGYAFASLFWPNLVEFGGGVFLREQFTEKTFASWMVATDGNLTAIEAAMNHVHV